MAWYSMVWYGIYAYGIVMKCLILYILLNISIKIMIFHYNIYRYISIWLLCFIILLLFYYLLYSRVGIHFRCKKRVAI